MPPSKFSWSVATPDYTRIPIVQAHGGNIAVLEEIPEGESVEADGLVTRQENTLIEIRTADCLPLGIISKDAVGIFHISRKTVIKGLLDNMPKYMDVNNIEEVYIGPHICAEHFSFATIGEEIQAFIEKFPESANGKDPLHISLQSVVERCLKEWGVTEDKVFSADICTYENLNLPSYRRNFEQKKEMSKDRIITSIKKSAT